MGKRGGTRFQWGFLFKDVGPRLNTLRTLNADFTLAYPIDCKPDSGRVFLRCLSAKALRNIPYTLKSSHSPTGNPQGEPLDFKAVKP